MPSKGIEARIRWQSAITAIIRSSNLDKFFEQRNAPLSKTKGLTNHHSLYNFWSECYTQQVRSRRYVDESGQPTDTCYQKSEKNRNPYYSEEKRKACQITFCSGRIYIGHGESKRVLNTHDKVEWIELPNEKKRNESTFHVCHPGDGSAFHSQIASGKRVLCAGEMIVKEGKIQEISNKTGHYRVSSTYLGRSVERIPSTVFMPDAKFLCIDRDFSSEESITGRDRFLKRLYSKNNDLAEKETLYHSQSIFKYVPTSDVENQNDISWIEADLLLQKIDNVKTSPDFIAVYEELKVHLPVWGALRHDRMIIKNFYEKYHKLIQRCEYQKQARNTTWGACAFL